MTHRLSDRSRLGAVSLAVADVSRSLGFYRDLVGLAELSSDASRTTLGTGDEAVLHLRQEPASRPAPPRASGLYHTAILFPDRASLARVVQHLATNEYPFSGASDHLVSEAFYLADPDGHGVELYRDRPRAEWKWKDNVVEMASIPLDVAGLLAEADRPFDGAPAGTRIGHVHLKVSSVEDAETFYRDVIGFDVTAHFGDSATFMAAGGYHHHIGANIWQSRGAGAAGAGHVGLREIVIEVPSAADIEALTQRATGAGVKLDHELSAIAMHDPWGHRVVCSVNPRLP